ncbi:uncharacterized protein LOC125226771 [Leguminivora glycinivorella]|uniref:uncharacterized protein LOC125226771 n=1 Tax=Leguminivora glycinivorella TaxID=1035111 RepID=UPI00200F801A|nr:uncharacterized protein LOC125226771 [Leguminivora glycinivorella]
MSPLACSLFALAALLAAADAQMVQRCSTKTIGPVTLYQQPVASEGLPYGPSQIDFKNLCGAPMTNVGEKITVCNKTLNDYPAPVISAPDDGSVSPVSVYCADLAGCTAEPMSESCDFY